MNSSTWLGRFVAAGIFTAAVVACSSSTKDTGDDDASPPGSDAGTFDAAHVVDSGSDASPNNRVTNDAGQCVSNCHEGDPCTLPAECASGLCTAGACVEPSCTDGMLDGTETAPDCGGTCVACADGLACVIGADCESGVCDPSSKTCAVPTSTDTVKNGNETGVDCGSSGTGTNTHAPPCGDGQGCNDPGDCADKLCSTVTKTCTPSSCTDKIQNGTETGLDCGGLCDPCADGIGCKVDADCTSKSCDISGTHLCLAPTDTDTITNGNETDQDCGSSGTNDGGENTHAPSCADGKTCNVGSDCTDGVCDPTAKTCSAPSCTDKVQNGGETGVDCGYSIITLCPACGDGLGCSGNSDCLSLHCDTVTTHTCLAPTATDGIANGKESDVDCGSSGTNDKSFDTKAPPCLDINPKTTKTSVCAAGADCKSKYCNTTEKQCVDASSCSLPAVASATQILDVSVEATATTDAQGVANLNGAGLYAGIDTCGRGEATDAPATRNLESCCKSLDVTVTGEGAIRIDKYEVTSGRVRQFIEYVNSLEGDYNLQKWVLAQFNGAGAPITAAGTAIAAQIPTIQSGVTDVRYLYPSSSTGTLNMVQQLGGVSIDTGVPSDLQGCFLGSGNAGSSTYWWDKDHSAIVGSPPRNFTQDYYDIKPQNCAPYWMAVAFCAWDGGSLPTAADYEKLWGSSTYPWGSTSRNFQALGGDTAWMNAGFPLITSYTIDNLNDDSGGYFYYYPDANQNPATGPLGAASIVDTVDSQTGANIRLSLADFTPYIAAPGRFTPDITSLTATAGTIYGGDAWYDVAANLFEYHALAAANFKQDSTFFCDTSDGVLNSGTDASTCAGGTTACTRKNYKNQYLCGFIRGTGAANTSIMPGINWQGGSWEVHGIPTGGADNNYVEPMETQYGKTGFRCARPAE